VLACGRSMMGIECGRFGFSLHEKEQKGGTTTSSGECEFSRSILTECAQFKSFTRSMLILGIAGAGAWGVLWVCRYVLMCSWAFCVCCFFFCDVENDFNFFFNLRVFIKE